MDIIRKDRLRNSRGKLVGFSSLPTEKQEIFLKIKNSICEVLGNEIPVYVYGSYYWGLWDELSDYDVTLEHIFNNYKPDSRLSILSEITNRFKEEMDIRVDILIMRGDMGILIP